MAAHPFASTLQTFRTASGKEGRYFSLPALAKKHPAIHRLPVSIRIVLESVLRNCDGRKVGAEHVAQLANWKPKAERTDEIVYVCRFNKALRKHIQLYTKLLLSGKNEVLGIVLNGLSPRRIKYYSNYRYYRSYKKYYGTHG